MLEVRNLTSGYGRAQVLWDVSLTVGNGEIVTLLGPNGAGKTTLVNAIAGIHPPWSGEVLLDEINLTEIEPHRVSEQGIAVVPEGRRIFPDMSVADNLDIGAYNPRARPHREPNLDRIYDIFPRLAERKNQLAGSMSGGEQQMLSIGRALMAEPSTLLLDEPSLGLAPIIVENIFGVLAELNADGLSILLVEQNAVEALDLASRGYVVEEGRIVGDGTSEELLADERLREAYLGL
jgi:branched-chain amino acid transport system ATP-binding protein